MRIAAYCRVSSDREEQLNSLENQKEFFGEYAKKNRHTLVGIYADEGISGTSLKKRTEFLRLMSDAKEDRFDAVVVKDVSRFARNTVDFLQSVRALKRMGINTVFLNANMESFGESEFILAVFGALAQEESVNLSKRIKFGKQVNARKGRVPQMIFGYDRVDRFTLRICESESEIVRSIFRMYLEGGLGCRAIARELNCLGETTKLGCAWSAVAVRRILGNSIYCGDYVNNKYEIADCLEGKLVKKSEEEHLHHDRPEWAIISKEIFLAAQREIERRRPSPSEPTISPKGRHSSRHLFSTLIRCEHCGRAFARKSYTYTNTRVYWKCPTNDQYTAKVCPNRVTVDEGALLEAIRVKLGQLLGDRECLIAKIVAETNIEESVRKAKESEAKAAQRRRMLLAKKDKYVELYAAELLSLRELQQKNARLQEELQLLDRSCVASGTREDAFCDPRALSKAVEECLNLQNWSNADLRRIVQKISVNESGTVTVVLSGADGT